jgi:Lhr-like helicase
VDTVIIDEIHAVVPTKRGAHLALSLERLEAITEGRVQRIGLSATQRPLEEVAHFLGGASRAPSWQTWKRPRDDGSGFTRGRVSPGHHHRRQRTEEAGPAH